MNKTAKYSLLGVTVIATLGIALTSFDEFDANALVGEDINKQGTIDDGKLEGPYVGNVQTQTTQDKDNRYQESSNEKLYLVHISSGNPSNTNEVNSVLRGIESAQLLHDAGKDVVLYLDVDGVRVADANPTSSLGESHEALKRFLSEGGRVVACDECAGTYFAEDLLRGIEVDLPTQTSKLQRILVQADLVLNY